MITHVFSNINFRITSFTNVFFFWLFKSKKLFVSKALAEIIVTKVIFFSSFYLLILLLYQVYTIGYIYNIYIYIFSIIHLMIVINKTQSCEKSCFLSFSGICNKISKLEDKRKYSPVHLF